MRVSEKTISSHFQRRIKRDTLRINCIKTHVYLHGTATPTGISIPGLINCYGLSVGYDGPYFVRYCVIGGIMRENERGRNDAPCTKVRSSLVTNSHTKSCIYCRSITSTKERPGSFSPPGPCSQPTSSISVKRQQDHIAEMK